MTMIEKASRKSPGVDPETMMAQSGMKPDPYDETARSIEEGEAQFHRLGWKRLALILIVEAIALGSLSLPAAFAILGMVPGVLMCVLLGLAAMQASYTIGAVKLKYPHARHYVEIGRLMMGSFGYHLFSVAFVTQLILVVGSHCLTGKIAFKTITESDICSIIFGVVSMVLLMLLAIPPSFSEIAILGYIDFASIIIAIGVTMIATGIQSSNQPGGLSAVPWSAWPKENLTFREAFSAVTNIVFAYAFAIAQPSFMDELHTPTDFKKSIQTIAVVEIAIYTLTGSIIYAFVGQDVQSPALLSAGPLLARIGFGIAFPVIFISGSINITVVCRYIHGQMYHDSTARYVNTKKGWVTWLALVSLVSVLAWVVSEAVPIFSDLLSIISALFVSGFSYYIPPIMWFVLLKKGKWYHRKNLVASISSAIVFIIGIVVFSCGTYASIAGLVTKFRDGAVGKPFTCAVN
ncbi:N amino acid transport system protein [Neonectria ditissima]|uniref:N amino acid transport system protein n=1 Tax=Neonectria ditissima TaxID=78410 RepID=A0A0P7AVN7_9HYPO|nr:N amino acid transport system protein [Neonectria ditissima]